MNWLDAIGNPLESDLASQMGGDFVKQTFVDWVQDAGEAQENLWRVGRDGVAKATDTVALYTYFIDGEPGSGIHAGSKP